MSAQMPSFQLKIITNRWRNADQSRRCRARNYSPQPEHFVCQLILPLDRSDIRSRPSGRSSFAYPLSPCRADTAVSALRYQRVISAVNLLVLASWSHSPIGSEWRPGEVHHTALPAAPGFYENRFSFSASISSMDRPAVSGIHFQSMMKAMTLITPKIP